MGGVFQRCTVTIKCAFPDTVFSPPARVARIDRLPALLPLNLRCGFGPAPAGRNRPLGSRRPAYLASSASLASLLYGSTLQLTGSTPSRTDWDFPAPAGATSRYATASNCAATGSILPP